MSHTDTLLENNRRYAAAFDKGDTPLPPARGLAVVACMDARLEVHGLLGLEVGDAHIIRNAGGAVTEDVIRSLTISQRLLGTTEIVLIHHTDCGMLTFRNDDLASTIEEEVGVRPPFTFEPFTSLEADVLQSIERIRTSPFVPRRDSIRGFVYDVRTGALTEVTAAGRAASGNGQLAGSA